MTQKPIIVTPGQPAGIGPDILIKLVQHRLTTPIVTIAEPEHLQQRAHQLKLPLKLVPWDDKSCLPHTPGTLPIMALTIENPVTPGHLDPANANYVAETIRTAVSFCLSKKAAAVITGPVNKAVMNQAQYNFSGQTEFIAHQCQIKKPVMMLANDLLRVALVTTHLPLRRVADAISRENIMTTVKVVHHDLQQSFGIAEPRLFVCGLNPHAGENGYLGKEEIEVINPALSTLQRAGLNVSDAIPADTLFTEKYLQQADAIIAMYHDQGLPVVKSMGFGQVVNISLGLPIIRTSVDHGTAIELAGSGKAEASSLLAAYYLTETLIENRQHANS